MDEDPYERLTEAWSAIDEVISYLKTQEIMERARGVRRFGSAARPGVIAKAQGASALLESVIVGVGEADADERVSDREIIAALTRQVDDLNKWVQRLQRRNDFHEKRWMKLRTEILNAIEAPGPATESVREFAERLKRIGYGVD